MTNEKQSKFEQACMKYVGVALCVFMTLMAIRVVLYVFNVGFAARVL